MCLINKGSKMRKILVTGGTVFVSKYVAEYYLNQGDKVYVLNRKTREQPIGAILIQADRYNLTDELKKCEFDIVIDVTAYTGEDINNLLAALGSYKEYIMISSSAVYPEFEKQPFKEECMVGKNKYWGKYGTNKIDAEVALMKRVPSAYILRPPYLYGPLNNVYREAFVFDCAMADRKFYLPGTGEMKLHFFHINDLCKCIDAIIEYKPKTHVLNVGNYDTISVRAWVEMIYLVAGKNVEFEEVHEKLEQREFFSFYDYEYKLDLTNQARLLEKTMPLAEGLKECYLWYLYNKGSVSRKVYMEYIDSHF